MQILHGRNRRDLRSDDNGVNQNPLDRVVVALQTLLAASGHVVLGGTLLTTVRYT